MFDLRKALGNSAPANGERATDLSEGECRSHSTFALIHPTSAAAEHSRAIEGVNEAG